jgi:signal transduction histidine kinase
VEAFLAAIGLALVRDPFFDPACYSNCALNVFLVRSLPTVARAIQSADRWFVAAAAVSLIGMCFWRLASASRAARRTLAPVVLPGVLFAAATVARAVDLQHVGVENPFNDVLLTIFVVEAIALLLLAVGLSAAVWRTLSERRAVARIVTGLGEAPEPGSVQAALAAVLSDPGLRIAYPLTGEGRYIDARGRHVDGPVPGDGRVITRLVRADRTIAIVSQSAGTRELEQRLGPALLLALENERLQAELLAELEELRASRLRIVETTETERRRLERDLHDGAQQRLLALSYDVRRVRAAAESVADERTGTLLARAIDQTQTALEGLRRVAHGIYPAILAEAGLAAALATFADTAPLPVQLKGIEDRRYPGPVESAVYFSVVETVADAVDRGAGRVTVRASHEEGRLDLEVEDDGSERTSPMVSIIDRIGAAGGEVVAEPRRIRVSIPCE